MDPYLTPERVAEIRRQVRRAQIAARNEPPAPALTAAEVIAELNKRVAERHKNEGE